MVHLVISPCALFFDWIRTFEIQTLLLFVACLQEAVEEDIARAGAEEGDGELA